MAFVKVKSVEIFHRKYVPAKDSHRQPPGNSNVEFYDSGLQLFGRISRLFKDSVTNTVWFLIRPFATLNRWDEPKNPYKDHPQLNTRLLYANKLGRELVIHHSRVVGHIAILENEEGTFGVNKETISAVSLGNIAWSQDIESE
ncbi:uncharacterized protein PGTG_03927 [Puccinia graminis f. sp. tritici CRL 75-36-700-3]|uniref:Uncharacterized protein n=1 Tax=Puccinia graminis f. sp. tritici (strain CRL 75-36-700-3 / race SCCL) TaxID=418459 RepID=E3K0Z6_PUCGT|nr:uncharacterized protein PGTG_03927 [Puccinia graminis f. sp. tritici CRL 75-36-700-3]EFP77971.1 hypothetical protein PGTG_03927 [Puccinia graminis f. sp. tritici CRL 75-36-700-3]